MEDIKASSCGCGGHSESCSTQKTVKKGSNNGKWVVRKITSVGETKQVSTKLSFKDTLGSWKARWGINRMNYKIDPGLYCVGNPDENSPVLVSANYKMSFDRLRKELSDLNAWILVLDTKGVNVWCAAGKGTFGTKELIGRISKTGLVSIVKKKVLIVPQLGAPGITAHEVQKSTGFKVVYGPVRASDIKAFLGSDMLATKEMRTVKFTFTDRLVLTPMEVVNSIKPTLIIFGVLFILNSIGFGSYSYIDLYAYLGAILAGCVITPILLPWIPGRAFAFKGALIGLLWVAVVLAVNGFSDLSIFDWTKVLAYVFILPTISSYGAMNFTGCSTYTSLSGVDREMKFAIPSMLVTTGLGVISLLVGSIIRLL